MATTFAGASNTGTGNSLVVTRTTAAGSTLVLGISHPGANITSIVDSAGNTWLPCTDSAANNNSANGTVASLALWYCPNAAAITSVTINASASVLLLAGLVEVIAGKAAANGNNFRMVAQGYGTGTAVGPLTTSMGQGVVGFDILVAFAVYASTSSGVRQETVASTFGCAAFPAAQAISGTTVLACMTGLSNSSGGVTLSWTVPTARVSGGVQIDLGQAYVTPTLGFGLAGSPGALDMTTWRTRRMAWASLPISEAMTAAKKLVGQLWPRGAP